MSFEFYKQAINELNNYEETLPRFPNVNQNFGGFNPFSNRNDRIYNRTVQKYIQSISKSFVDLDNVTENDQNIIKEFSDLGSTIDELIDSVRPKPKHFKNVKPKPEPVQKTAKVEEKAKTPNPPNQSKLQKQEPQPTQGNISKKLNFISNPPAANYQPPSLFNQPPPSITETIRVAPQPEVKPFLTEQDYISVSALQEVKEPIQSSSREFSARDNNTVIIKDTHSGRNTFLDDYTGDSKRVDSATSQTEPSLRLINLNKVSFEKENKPNPFSSLGDKLNSLINERKAIEKQTKNEFIKKAPADKK